MKKEQILKPIIDMIPQPVKEFSIGWYDAATGRKVAQISEENRLRDLRSIEQGDFPFMVEVNKPPGLSKEEYEQNLILKARQELSKFNKAY